MAKTLQDKNRRANQVSEKQAHMFCSLSNLHYLCKRKDKIHTTETKNKWKT